MPSSRLIFHIGAGKTGTSSVQAALQENLAQLQRAGILYLGLMFENSPAKRYPWQRFGGQDEFLALPATRAENEFREVLDATLAIGSSQGVHTYIWSSESFFDRYEPVLKPLQTAADSGVDVSILAYVRRHDAWVRSAYLQWGLKHKTYRGPIQPFHQWVERRRPFFAPTIRRYEQEFPGKVVIRNYDAAGDVVGDFLAAVGLNLRLDTNSVRVNESVDGAELLLRTLYNDKLGAPALPIQFDRVVGRGLVDGTSPTDYLNRLFPTVADIVQVNESVVNDRSFLNRILKEQGQPLLAEPEAKVKPSAVNSDQLIFGLAKLAVNQARRIDALEAELKKLAEAEGSGSGAFKPVASGAGRG